MKVYAGTGTIEIADGTEYLIMVPKRYPQVPSRPVLAINIDPAMVAIYPGQQ